MSLSRSLSSVNQRRSYFQQFQRNPSPTQIEHPKPSDREKRDPIRSPFPLAGSGLGIRQTAVGWTFLTDMSDWSPLPPLLLFPPPSASGRPFLVSRCGGSVSPAFEARATLRGLTVFLLTVIFAGGKCFGHVRITYDWLAGFFFYAPES